MKSKRMTFSAATIFIILFYLSISDFFGLFDTSLFIPGELYQYILILLLGFSLIKKRGSFVIKENPISFGPYYLLMVIAIIHSVLLQKSGGQGLFESFSVVIELLYLFTCFAFSQIKIDNKSIIRCIVMLDAIAVFVYALEMICGGPILSAAIHTSGLYQPIGGFTVWRCWVDIPVFEFFTLPYLLIGILKKDNLFPTLQKDKIYFFIIFLGVILKLGRTELFAVLVSLVLAYFYVDKVTVSRLMKKAIKVILYAIPAMIVLYFVANGVFMRILNGILEIFNSSISSNSISTFATRTSTLYVRWNYLIEHRRLLFGIGPYSYKSTLVIDAYDIYATNRGVFAPDSAYGTFIIRYGIIGTGLYVFGNIRNFVLLIKEKSAVCLATAVFLISVLISGFGGYDAMGKQTMIKVGILFALCMNDMRKRREECKLNPCVKK